jgi:hypothetical protein
MRILEQLDDLNLDAAAKTQVTALIQALLDQVKKDAETIEANTIDIQSKDLKIQALILELAHLRRIRYGVKKRSPVRFTTGFVRGILQRRHRGAGSRSRAGRRPSRCHRYQTQASPRGSSALTPAFAAH